MTGKKTVLFSDLLSQKTWRDYSEFVRDTPRMYEEEVDRHVREERELIRHLREHPDFKKLQVYSVTDGLDQAYGLLSNGQVVGVDGALAKYRLFSGIRCQIGIVAVNYLGEKIRHSFFISEAGLREEPEDAIERVAGRMESEDNLSEMALRGLMLYREREAGLDATFEQAYVMFHGPLLPFELMSGLGRLRALETTLGILRSIVREKRFFSVISSTAYQDYLTFGRALLPGQYLTASSYTLAKHLTNTSGFLSYRQKWREDERNAVEEFLSNYADRILIGVIRVGERPYVFHAHKDTFHLAATIIARDAMFEKEKGFPLLIDYADSLCSQYFQSSDFQRLIEWQLAKRGAYLSEAPEQDLRLK